MPGYRFCRSDDIPLLVAAHNACWVPHFGPTHAITVDDFKRGIRELGLWSSSCMVAFDGDEPIGVLIGAKRDKEANCVHRLAVRPGWERRGHGRHLLTSLAEKAAILGPARLVAEIPTEWAAVRGFFERSAFVVETTYADFVADTPPAAPPTGPDDLIVPIGLDELRESGLLDPAVRRAWCRSPASLRARAEELDGLAVATDRLEAFVLSRPADEGRARTVMALGAADDAQGRALLALLMARVRAGAEVVRVPMLSESEMAFATLEAMGFRRTGDYVGYVADNQRT